MSKFPRNMNSKNTRMNSLSAPRPNYSSATPAPVLIGMTAGDMIHTDFMASLTYMMLAAQSTGAYLGLNVTKSTLIDVGRNHVVREALKSKASHLLFVDTDMVFPADTLHRLMNHRKDIVGATYCSRREPRRLNHLNLDGSSDVQQSGLYQVESLPSGLILIRTEVFEKLAFPWYSIKWINETSYVGEDVHFCQRVGRAGLGYDIWLDAELSAVVRHCGTFHYTLEHAQYGTEIGSRIPGTDGPADTGAANDIN